MTARITGGYPVGGNLGAFLGQSTGENIAPLFRGAMQQPGGMLTTGAGIGGFLGSNMGSQMPGNPYSSVGGFLGSNMGSQMSGNPYSSVGNSLGMLTGQNIAFNPLAGISEIGQKVGGKLKDFLNRPVMPDTIDPNTGNSIYFDAMPPETQKRFRDAMNKGY